MKRGVTIDRVSMVFLIDRQKVLALDDVSVAIEPGAFVAIIGPSGCGKSTLLRLVADILTPSAGTIRIGDRTPRELRLERQIGFVFQDPTLLPWRTVIENIELPLIIAGKRHDSAEPSAAELIQLVGLRGFENAKPAQLSGGMQQRVAIARALMLRPGVLLLDEPFGALDEITRQRMNLELLRIWATTGSTTLFITHSIAEAAFMADRVLVMSPRPGRIVADMAVPLPRPRTIDDMRTPAFVETVNTMRDHLFSGEQALS